MKVDYSPDLLIYPTLESVSQTYQLCRMNNTLPIDIPNHLDS